jgi:hypothetical protein
VAIQSIQAGTSGDIIPITCQRATAAGTITPIDFTGATAVSVIVTGPGASSTYTPAVVAASSGQLQLTTVTSMFTVPAGEANVSYNLQVVATLANGNVYRSPRASLLVLA